MLHVVFLTRLQKRPGAGRIVSVVLQRVGERLRHDRVCREVHDRIEFVLGKEFIQQCSIARVPHDQVAGLDGIFEAGAEVVERHDRFAGRAELPHDVAADISSPASDEYLLVIHEIYRPKSTIVNHLLPRGPDSINTDGR